MTHNQAETLLNAAFDAYNQGDFYLAEENARAARRLSPYLADSWYLLGVLAFRANALESSCDTLYQAVQLDKKNSAYQLMLASVLHKLGRLDEALTYYQKHPENADALAQIGYIYIQQKKDKEAKEVFKKALSLNPQHPEALIGMAVLERKKEHDQKALEILKTAPLTGNVAYQLSLQYLQMKQEKQALEMIQKALSIQESPAFLVQEGLCQAALNKEQEAEECYQKALKLDRFYAEAHLQLGHLYLKQKFPLQAIEEYKRAINENRDCIEAYHALGVVLYQEDQKEMALEYYRKALRICPTYIPTLYNLANILREQGVFDEAAGLYVHLLLLPYSPDISVELGACLLQMQDQKMARRFAKGWVKHFPKSKMAIHIDCLLHGKKSAFEKEFAQTFFDAFADEYDEKMKQLSVRVIPEMMPLIKTNKEKILLDLGCGTGGIGRELKGQFKKIVGVDISSKMIQKARQTKAYHQLKTQDILTFLKNATEKYDYILSADVFCYIQDLSDIFKEVRACLNQTGEFIFSIETAQKTTQKNGRFLFSIQKIRALLRSEGFQIKTLKKCLLRKEGDTFAQGVIICAIKNKNT